MTDTSDARKPSVGPFRRVCAVLLSLAFPGAGQCLLGAFRRGVAWPVGLAILQLLLLYVVPIGAAVWSQLAVGIAGRAAAAIDTARTVRPTPAWGRVAAAWLVVIVTTSLVNLAVVTPLATVYARRYAQPLVIRTGGMEPTLLVGDSILVDRSAYRDRAPRRYDLVVFPAPQYEEQDFVKRIVACPATRLSCAESWSS